MYAAMIPGDKTNEVVLEGENKHGGKFGFYNKIETHW
jgi:hypothetical protein